MPTSKSTNKTLAPCIACVAILVCGFSCWQNLRDYRSNREPDLAVLHEKRLEPVRPLLSPSKPVAFLGGMKRPDGHNRMVFVLSQYALAPTPIVDSPAADTILCNSLNVKALLADLKTDTLELVQDFGHGVRLYRKKQ